MALFACGGALLSAGLALRWGPEWLVVAVEWNPAGLTLAWIAAAFFAMPAAALLFLALRPPIQIHETHLQIGSRAIPWAQIHRLDQTGWNVPLMVQLTFHDGNRELLIYAGDFESSATLLRHLRRSAREALLDGVPYRQFWGEPVAPERKQIAPPRYPLLRPEDEEEVERMLQRLKTVGHLEHHEPDKK